MRFKQYNGSGYGLNGLTPAGGVISAPLYLSTTITNPLHAVTKEYVDQTLSSVAGNRITGNIPADRFPAFTGADIFSTDHGIFTIKNSGVTAGTYNKVIVNSKGFVVNGETVDYSILTDAVWSSITQDKPTTLEGYGITDALRTTGGTMSGALLITDTPSQPKHLVNKGYVDATVIARETLGGKIGDIVQSLNINTPARHLRTNGSTLNKASYAALYAIIGDMYSSSVDIAGYIGQPWRQQYAFNASQSAVLGPWTTATPLPTMIAQSQAVVTKNRVYLLGGATGTATAVVYTAPINADGTLGTWTTGTSLPNAVHSSQAIVTKNRVYLLGGVTTSGSSSKIVYTAPINEDGTLGVWATDNSLPGVVAYSQAIVTKNRVYLLGGYASTASAVVYTAPINADGTLGAWTTGTPLPATIYYSQAIVTKNRVYLLSGYIAGIRSSVVYTAPINEDGTLGAWTTGTALPIIVYMSQAIVTKNRVYLLGGATTNGGSLATTYTAPINADGTLGVWTTGTSLPSVVYVSQAIVTSSKVYTLGSGTTAGNEVYQADFTGGTNDYLTLIANNTATPTTQFKLPDTVLTDPLGIYSYIRAI